MRSFFRFIVLVLLIGVGVALAIAVVTGSDPPSQHSPNQVVQALIHSACPETGLDATEPGDPASADAATVDSVPSQVDAEEPTPAEDDTSDPTPVEKESTTDDVPESLTLPSRDAMPTINASAVYITPPAMAASPFAMPGHMAPYQVPYYPMVANQVAQPAVQSPFGQPAVQDPFAQPAMQPPLGQPAVPSPVGQPAVPTPLGQPAVQDPVGQPTLQDQIEEPSGAEPAPNPESLPAPPDDDAQTPDRVPQSQIEHDEGDDSLVVNLKDSDIREVLESLSQYGDLNILASKNVTGKVSATLSGVGVRDALMAILKSTGYVARYEGDFVYVGTPEDFTDMDHAQDVISTRIYRPNYVTATELQMLITPLLTDGVSTLTVSSPSEVDIPSDAVKTGGDNFANGDVLLVRDYETVLAQIDQIVQEVDQPPLQVAIEAVILSVNLDDSMKIGVNFELLRDNRNTRIISGMPPLDLATIDFPPRDGGLKIGFLDSNLSALLEALETVGDTNVVASPKVMCLNKQRAEVHIGEELGYVTTTVTETASTQTVEFLEVGTQLRIRPFISSDGMIRMEIHPELSKGSLRPVQDMTIPDKEVTQVTSNIMCRDGCTVVIGGLIREQLDSTTSQIPLFGSLPLFGPAFRQKTEKISRDEIVVLITPRIMHEPFTSAEGQEEMCRARDRVEVFADKMSPIGTRYYGRQFYRKAQAAFAAGDIDTALRYVNLSIHFDRQNTDALGLRREIVAVCPQPDNNVDARLRQGLPPWQYPHVEYSRQGWPSRAPVPAPRGEEIIQIEEIPPPAPGITEYEVVDDSSAEDQTPRAPAHSPTVELADQPALPEEDQ